MEKKALGRFQIMFFYRFVLSWMLDAFEYAVPHIYWFCWNFFEVIFLEGVVTKEQLSSSVFEIFEHIFVN